MGTFQPPSSTFGPGIVVLLANPSPAPINFSLFNAIFLSFYSTKHVSLALKPSKSLIRKILYVTIFVPVLSRNNEKITLDKNISALSAL